MEAFGWKKSISLFKSSATGSFIMGICNIFYSCQIQKMQTVFAANLSNFKRPENNFYCQLTRFYLNLNFCGNLQSKKINILKNYQGVKTEIPKAIVLQLEQQ